MKEEFSLFSRITSLLLKSIVISCRKTSVIDCIVSENRTSGNPSVKERMNHYELSLRL